jgi:FMN phosphatase YigB (HAD superfamily)
MRIDLRRTRLATALRSVVRLTRGAFQNVLPGNVASGRRWVAEDSYDVLSLDVFDTLLVRRSRGVDPRPVVAEATARLAARLLREQDGAVDTGRLVRDAATRWRTIAKKLALNARRIGKDPEIYHGEIWHALLSHYLHEEPAASVVGLVRSYQLELEYRSTFVADDVCALAKSAMALRKRVIAVSDTYLCVDELRDLLSRHGLLLDRLYASCEVGLSKFSGRLFSLVTANESLEPQRVLHVGNSRVADVWSAKSAGLSARHYRTPKSDLSFRSPTGGTDAAFALGERVIGPALASFVHAALLRADDLGVTTIAFIARDGDLPLRIARVLAPQLPLLAPPTLKYVHLSRRSTALAWQYQLDFEELNRAQDTPANAGDVYRLLASQNLAREIVAPFVERSAAEPRERPSETIVRLAKNDEFHSLVAAESNRQRTLLQAYLRQEGFFGERIALVDIGWNGTIQDSLVRAFGADPNFAELFGIYLGFWPNRAGRFTDLSDRKFGVIADIRRGSNAVEGSAWHVAFLLEAICRAPHGPVIGYRVDETGKLEPVHAASSASDVAESTSRTTWSSIRAGVLSAAERYAQYNVTRVLETQRSRRRTQLSLARLAFLPTSEELQVAMALVHTETSAEGWYAPLIAEDRVTPWAHPRVWLAGFRSPWRSGYIAATAGRPIAVAYGMFESLLGLLPRSAVRRLHRLALRVARVAA